MNETTGQDLSTQTLLHVYCFAHESASFLFPQNKGQSLCGQLASLGLVLAATLSQTNRRYPIPPENFKLPKLISTKTLTKSCKIYTTHPTPIFCGLEYCLRFLKAQDVSTISPFDEKLGQVLFIPNFPAPAEPAVYPTEGFRVIGIELLSEVGDRVQVQSFGSWNGCSIECKCFFVHLTATFGKESTPPIWPSFKFSDHWMPFPQ